MTDLPRTVTLQEVALRDGIQNEKRIVPTETKILLIDRLVACGVKQVEVSSFVNPRLVPQMADAEDLWRGIRRRDGVRYSGLILSENGLDRAIRCAVPHVGIYVSASETHSRKNSNRSVAEALEESRRLIRKARSAGMGVRAGVMNAFGCAYEGRIDAEKVAHLSGRLLDAGPDEICLADSAGLGNPLQIKTVLSRVRRATGNTPLALHLHNTRGFGPANVYSALEEGITSFDTSLGGLGGCPFIAGARGNIATEDTVSMLQEMGIETGIRLDSLIAASLDFENALGVEFPAIAGRLCKSE